MATYKLANGSTIEFSATFATSVDVSAISNANPAVVTTATAHNLVAGDVVVLNAGWARLTGRTFRVGTASGSTFTLVGVDTTNVTLYPANTVQTGTVKKVATWVAIPEVTELTTDGGDQQNLTIQFLEDSSERQIPTVKSAMSLSITVADDPTQAYVPVLEAADDSQAINVARINLAGGDQIYMSVIASITTMPTLTINELMARTISFALQGKVSRFYATV